MVRGCGPAGQQLGVNVYKVLKNADPEIFGNTGVS